MRRVSQDDPRSPLPSWRSGFVLEQVMAFLSSRESLPLADRVGVDNDGTLWCEKPA